MAIGMSGRSAIAWENNDIDGSQSTYYEVRDEQNQKIDSTRRTATFEYYYRMASMNRLSMSPSGCFIIVWEAAHTDPHWMHELGFYPLQPTARIFDALGNPLSNEIYVACEGFPETCSGDSSIYQGGHASGKYPQVAMQNNGDFAVVYRRDASFDCTKEYYCLRRFYADGTPKGPNVKVNDMTECYAYTKPSRLMSDSIGNLLVVWNNNNVNGNYSQWANLYAQRFDSNGERVGVNYRLNDVPATYTTGVFVEYFGADMNENGLVAVVWLDQMMSGPGHGLSIVTMDVHDIGFFKPGDANRDLIVSISDAVFLVNFIFAGGYAPIVTCLGDADGNGFVSISDAVCLVNFIFNGGSITGECP
jgi:hypothetical protein